MATLSVLTCTHTNTHTVTQQYSHADWSGTGGRLPAISGTVDTYNSNETTGDTTFSISECHSHNYSRGYIVQCGTKPPINILLGMCDSMAQGRHQWQGTVHTQSVHKCCHGRFTPSSSSIDPSCTGFHSSICGVLTDTTSNHGDAEDVCFPAAVLSLLTGGHQMDSSNFYQHDGRSGHGHLVNTCK